jgi:hypothetical protein
MKFDVKIVLLLLFVIGTAIYYRSNIKEYFEQPSNLSANLGGQINITENVVVAQADIIPRLKIVEYYTEDGGVTIHWERPHKIVDYLALIKDEEGSDEIKLYFKDTLEPNCDEKICKYSFQNLENGRKYSIVIAAVTDKGMGEFSNKVAFIPTFQKMQCNVNGTCAVIKTAMEPTLDAKIESVLVNKDSAKEVLSKCQNILQKEDNTFNIDKIYEADGHFSDVKDKLKYPEHLLLPIKKGPDSLAELIKHQLELGIINVNVHTKDMADEFAIVNNIS